MIKPLSLLSISAAVLLASTQSYGHVLCAPNDPTTKQAHTHHQSYAVPRITQTHHQNQKFLQAQRARQQKALADQQRINQQRRAEAKRREQLDRQRKARLVRQQQLAAQKARVVRQQTTYIQPTTHQHSVQPGYTTQPVHYQPSHTSLTVSIGHHNRAVTTYRSSGAPNRHTVHYPKHRAHRSAHHHAARQHYRAQHGHYHRHAWRAPGYHAAGKRHHH